MARMMKCLPFYGHTSKDLGGLQRSRYLGLFWLQNGVCILLTEMTMVKSHTMLKGAAGVKVRYMVACIMSRKIR